MGSVSASVLAIVGSGLWPCLSRAVLSWLHLRRGATLRAMPCEVGAGAHRRGQRCSLSREHRRGHLSLGAQFWERQRAHQRKIHPEEPLWHVLHVQKSPGSEPHKKPRICQSCSHSRLRACHSLIRHNFSTLITSAISFTLCLETGF